MSGDRSLPKGIGDFATSCRLANTAPRSGDRSLPKGIGDKLRVSMLRLAKRKSGDRSLPKGIGDRRSAETDFEDSVSGDRSLPKGIGDYSPREAVPLTQPCRETGLCRKALVTKAITYAPSDLTKVGRQVFAERHW